MMGGRCAAPPSDSRSRTPPLRGGRPGTGRTARRAWPTGPRGRITAHGAHRAGLSGGSSGCGWPAGWARIAWQLGLNPSTVYKVLARYRCPRLAHLDRGSGVRHTLWGIQVGRHPGHPNALPLAGPGTSHDLTDTVRATRRFARTVSPAPDSAELVRRHGPDANAGSPIPGHQWAITACRRWPEWCYRTPDAVTSHAGPAHPGLSSPIRLAR
jgi:hypothetical protein